MNNFISVATSAARHQDISLNPQKLAGQCAKLKCCINFEVDAYVEASKQLPPRDVRLETIDSTYYHFKTDIFGKQITYSTDKNMPVNLVTISAERAFEVIAINKSGAKVDKLRIDDDEREKEMKAFGDIIGQDAINRFDKKKKKKKPQGQKPQRPQGQQGNGSRNSDSRGGEQKGNNQRSNRNPNDQQRFNKQSQHHRDRKPNNAEQAD